MARSQKCGGGQVGEVEVDKVIVNGMQLPSMGITLLKNMPTTTCDLSCHSRREASGSQEM